MEINCFQRSCFALRLGLIRTRADFKVFGMLVLGLVSRDKALCEAALEQIKQTAVWQVTLFETPAEALAVWGGAPPPLVALDAEGCASEETGAFFSTLRACVQAPWTIVIGGTFSDEDDDSPECLGRPLRLGQFLARLRFYKSLLEKPADTHYRLGALMFAPRRRCVRFIDSSEELRLTDKETALLEYLVVAEKPVPKEELLEEIWGYGTMIDTHTLETHIYRLRRKLAGEEKQRSEGLVFEQGGYWIAPAWRGV